MTRAGQRGTWVQVHVYRLCCLVIGGASELHGTHSEENSICLESQDCFGTENGGSVPTDLEPMGSHDVVEFCMDENL